MSNDDQNLMPTKKSREKKWLKIKMKGHAWKKRYPNVSKVGWCHPLNKLVFSG